MRRLRSPLVRDLLKVADELASTSLRGSAQSAAYRRAVSTAYYAVFHAICYVCVEGLGLWSRPADILEPIYRLVDHGAAKTRLTAPHAQQIDPAVAQIGRIFVTLQQHRHDADYRAPGQIRYSRKQALGLIASAQDAVNLIEALTPDARLSLAILLIGSRRAT